MQNSTDGTNSPDDHSSPDAAQPSRGFLDRVRRAPAATAAVGAAVVAVAAVTTAMTGGQAAPPPAGAGAPPAPAAAAQQQPAPQQPVGPAAPAAPSPQVKEDQLRKKIIETAQPEVGTKETGKDCQPYSPQCVSWCALFAMKMWQQAGVNVNPEQFAFTGNVYTTGQEKGTAFDKEHLHEAKPGDVLLVGSGPSSAQTSEHIVIVESVQGDKITTIEGNSGPNSDQVAHKEHDLSADTFYGGVHPW